MIKIFTVYFEGKYKPEYVSKLYRGLKANCKVPFEFICLSDTKEVEADRVIMLPKWSNIKLHWHKLKFFSPLFGNQKPGDDIIVLDIDQIIVNDVTEMINYPVGENEIVTYRKWWKKGDPNSGNTVRLNGGWYKFKSGSLKFVWEKFTKSSKSIDKWCLHYFKNGTVHYKYYGEQNFVEDTCLENGVKITHMPGEWIVKVNSEKDRNHYHQLKYMKEFGKEYMILDKPHDDIKIVHFAGAEKLDTIHDCDFDWIKDYWK